MADGSRSSSTESSMKKPDWVQWLMPSVADLIFLALLGTLTLTALSTRLLGDAGIGWHIRTGQQILSSHVIPRTDPFSSMMHGKPWFAWEWLYDIVVGQLDSSFGLNGVVWFTSVLIASVFAWTFRMLMLRGTSLILALVLVLLAISASMIHFFARPHVVSWLFTLAWFWILDSTERDSLEGRGSSSRLLWLLPLSMLVWVNVHGGFLFGFALLAIFSAGCFWTWFRSDQNRIEESFQKITAGRRLRTLTWISAVSALATLVNPYGWKLHEHIYSYLSNRFLMDHIEEFQSPNFHGVAQKCFLLLLLISIAAIAAGGRKLRVSELLLILFATYAGLIASRNIPVSSILLILLVGPLLPPVDFFGFVQRTSSVDVRLRGHLWAVVACVVLLLIAANRGRLGSTQVMDAHFDPNRMPVEAVNDLVAKGLKGPVLAPDSWGGYLIYRLSPQEQIVIDDRHDLYGEKTLKSYLKMIRVEPGWEEFLNQRDVSTAVLPSKSALSVVLGHTPGWKMVYSDDVATTFIRAGLTPKDTEGSSDR
jgi:hypothetical protein